jgi:hypothetical protein
MMESERAQTRDGMKYGMKFGRVSANLALTIRQFGSALWT